MLNNTQGFQTTVWGPAAWLFLHCIALNYQTKQKRVYKLFFKNLGGVLPCGSCRDNYHRTITRHKRSDWQTTCSGHGSLSPCGCSSSTITCGSVKRIRKWCTQIPSTVSNRWSLIIHGSVRNARKKTKYTHAKSTRKTGVHNRWMVGSVWKLWFGYQNSLKAPMCNKVQTSKTRHTYIL